ncbi:MAG: hypothetical protein PHE33_05450 [Bacteroidales bacterium]|nr:hypothetical protein [Bacteroidales bacterium]
MKTKVFILILVMFGLTFSSCKKYEDGPAISFKSKNARLTGEWKLVAYSNEETSSSGTSTESYNGTTMTTSDGSYSYSYTLIIDKDGTYNSKSTYENHSYEDTKYWSWFNGTTSKEQIILDGDIYNIKQLKNKELILEQTYSYKSFDDNSTTPTYFSTTNTTWTYEKQ